MLIDTKKIRNKLRELSEELPSWESAWLAIHKMENYLTELEETPEALQNNRKKCKEYSPQDMQKLQELKDKLLRP